MKKGIHDQWKPAEPRKVVKKKNTQVEFKTKAGKIVRVDAFKTSTPKLAEKNKSSSRKVLQSKKK